MSDNSYQLNIFNFDKEHYKITKPIRLIELFAGIGAQAKALEILGAEFEHYKICEWAAQSIKAYNAIHLKDFTDYSVGKTKNELIEYLQGNISVDYNAPCDVSRKNEAWLRETYNNCIATHNLMNIMKTHGKDLEIVDTDKYEYVMTYSFPCVIAGTKVKTNSGYKNIEEITTNDKVLTHSGKYQKVLKTMNRTSDHYYIIKGVGCKLYLTEEHPLFVLRNGEIKWVKVKDLKLTDRISYNINIKNISCSYSNQFLWLLGRYIADGYIGNYNSVCFAIGNKKTKSFEENTPNFEWKTFKKKGCVEYRIADYELSQLCLEFSKGATHKKIPQWIIDLPREQLNAFFNGYMSGDGHKRERANTTQLMCSTVSKDLYLGLQDIMIKLFNSCPSLYIRKDKRKETFSDTYNLQLSLHYKNIWQDKIKNHLFVKLSSIERVEEPIGVYNIEVENDNSYTCDNVIVHNCQDLSLAGNGKGMATSQAQGGTRSGLLWEVERILDEVENKPQILLMENVSEVTGQKNVKHFNKWLAKLESLGYSNFFQILNSKNYGIPQNRKRCFMVSILGEYAYDFPLKIKLEYRLKDFLEKQVDEKYFLSDKMLQFLNDETNRNGFIRKKHSRPTDNFIEVFDFRYDEGIRGRVDNDLSPTITTNVGSKGLSGQPLIKVPQATKQGYAEVEEGDEVYIDRLHQKRGVVQKGISPTIKTQGRDIGVVVHSNNKRLNETADKIIDQDTQILDCYNKTLHKKVAPTITTRVDASNSTFLFNKLRIRKLTPKECMRLMGFDDKDYLSLVEIGLSNSAIYHCAGDSIVTTCLMGLFGKMLLNEKEVKNKIEEYVETIKEQF